MTGLGGVYAPICTPFLADEELDLGALRSNLARYAEARVQGLLTLGSNGENRSLDEEERLDFAERILAKQREPNQLPGSSEGEVGV